MSAVFLDLDGTLTDSKPGILASLIHAFRTTGNDHLAEDDLTWMIGPTFHESFAKLGITDTAPVFAAYRERYSATGMFENAVYDGVPAAIEAMKSSGARLYLATAKPHVDALKITAHFGLAPHFVAEFGPELDGTRSWKGDLLAHALELTGEDPARSVMVGDRHHDMAAAAEVGMPSIAAAWGYGMPEEHEGAVASCAHPSHLPAEVKSVLGLD